MWLGFVTLGTAATLIIIASLWDKFQTSPTITGLDADFHEWDVPFPAVTLCPSDPLDPVRLDAFVNLSFPLYDNEMARDFKTMLALLARSNHHNLTTLGEIKAVDFPQISLQDIVFKITLRCDDLLCGCLWKSRPVTCCEYFKPIITDRGFCFTFNSKYSKLQSSSDDLTRAKPEYIYETDAAWAVTIQSQLVFQNSIKVYLHPWDERLSGDARPHHVWRGFIKTLSFSLKHTYTTENTRQLSIQQRKCVFSNEIKLKSARHYSYSACMIECEMEKAVKFCRCVPYYNPQSEEFQHCDVKGHTCLSYYADMLNDTRTCDCELGCDYMAYEVEKLSDTALTPRGTLEIGFVSWPMFRYKRELLFGWVDLLVSFGGIAGLFLGFSLLSGVEIIYYFTMRAVCANLQEDQNKTEATSLKVKRGNKKHRKHKKVSPLEGIYQDQCTALKQRKKSKPYVIPYLP